MSNTDYSPNLRMIDVNLMLRTQIGCDEFMGVDLTKPDYRLEIDTPTGGSVTFNRYATADFVMSYMINEGWTV